MLKKVVFWTISTIKDEKSAAKFHYIKTVSNKVVAQSIAFRVVSISVVTVSKCFLLVGFSRFCRKNLGFRFGLGFHDRCIVNFFMTRVVHMA